MLTMASSTHMLICASAIIISSILISAYSSSSSSSDPIVVRGAYYASWNKDTFPPSSINASLFTHIYYAFLVPDNATFTFRISPAEDRFLRNFTSTLRATKPPLQTLFSIGGGNADPDLFARMVSSKSSRGAFIGSCIATARNYGFDGSDLDWETPKDPKEMGNLALLFEEWGAEVRAESARTHRPALRITAAVYYSADTFLSGAQRAYPVGSIVKNLDWVNVMNYDYHGPWDKTATGAHAALYDPKTNLSTSFGIGSWLRAGLPGSKVVMGLPLYAHTWKVKDSSKTYVGAPAVDAGPGNGTLTFKQVVQFNKKNKAKVVFDKDTVSMYSVAGVSWVGYDDVTSVGLKIGFARAVWLRGYFFWAADYDYKWRICNAAFQLW